MNQSAKQFLQSLPHDIQSVILEKSLDRLYIEKREEWRLLHRENFNYCIKIFPQKFALTASIPPTYFSVRRMFNMRLPFKDTYIINVKWLWDPDSSVFKFKGDHTRKNIF